MSLFVINSAFSEEVISQIQFKLMALDILFSENGLKKYVFANLS